MNPALLAEDTTKPALPAAADVKSNCTVALFSSAAAVPAVWRNEERGRMKDMITQRGAEALTYRVS